MKNCILVSTMALSLSLFAAQAIQAQPLSDTNTPAVSTIKTKTVKIHMRNETAAAVTVQAGAQQVTVQPGKEASIKVPMGTQLVAVNATANHEAGGVLGTADSNLSGSTLVIN